MGIDTILRFGQKILIFGVFITLVYLLTSQFTSLLVGYGKSYTPCTIMFLTEAGLFQALNLYVSILVGGFISRRTLEYLSNM